MNLQHLKYAVEVEKTGSITQAAENLYMGQPNLSKAIKELEGTLGVAIFKRTSKGVLPTAQGKEFLRYAKSILDQVERMQKLEQTRLEEDLDYSAIQGLRLEAREKLSRVRPHSLGQASRISGVSPADISVLIIYLEQQGRQQA